MIRLAELLRELGHTCLIYQCDALGMRRIRHQSTIYVFEQMMKVLFWSCVNV
jgi:hypothetical protein